MAVIAANSEQKNSVQVGGVSIPAPSASVLAPSTPVGSQSYAFAAFSA